MASGRRCVRVLGDKTRPRFARRVAWRALVPTEMAAKVARAPRSISGSATDSHLVHYPVRGRTAINIVAITARPLGCARLEHAGARRPRCWRSYPAGAWSRHARDLIGMPDHWLKWALHERAPLSRWGDDPITLLGDAAHPMLPFLAQGAAMAIEDAAVLAPRLAAHPDDLVPAPCARYEARRRSRTTRVQRAARANGRVYHIAGRTRAVRNFVMRMLGGERLLQRYDWIYNWRAT